MKLLKYQRERLERRLLEIYTEPRAAKIAEMEKALADRVLEAYFRPHHEGLYRFNSLPDGWVMFCNHLHWSNGKRKGRYVSVETRRLPRELAQESPVIEDATIEDAYLEIENAKAELSKGRDQIRARARAALERCTTVRALQELWPEAANLMETTAVVANLPAIPIGDLNRAIGLKPVASPTEKKRRKRA